MAGQAARLTGTTAGGYAIGEPIGRGGMGEVYRAHHARLGRDVAVKTLPDHLVRDEIARARFLRESKIASRIVHPYVATVFDVIEHDDELLLVMELIEGRTLRERLRVERLSAEQVRRYGTEIAEALAAIHREGLVHRDLKPSNVMITPDDHVKVMDFGVAQPARTLVSPDAPTSTETLTEAGQAGGTPMYMSPEQLRGRAVDARSDLFSLGIVLYEAITGRHPFARESVIETASAIIHEPPGRGTEPDTLTATGPLRHIVTRLLDKEPKRRYQSAEIALEHLRAATSRPDAAIVEAAPASSSRWPLAAAAGAVALLLLVGAWAVTSGRIAPVGPAAGGEQAAVPAVGEARPLLAVLPFADETGEREDDARGRMLAALLLADLEDAGPVRPLDHERVDEIAPRSAGATVSARVARLRELAGARYVVTGRLFRDGSSYHATIDVYGPGSDEPLDSFRVASGRVAGLPAAMLAPLLASVAPAAEPPAEAPRTTLTTSDEQALLDFYRASELMRQARFTEAIERLESAAERDPRFVEAHLRLAEALYAAGFARRARERIARAERALADAGPLATDSLRLRVDAARAIVEDDKAARLETQRALVRRRPDDPAPRRAYAVTLVQDGRRDAAVAAAEQAVALDDADPRNHLALSHALEALSRLDEAAAATVEAERLYRAIESPAGLAVVEHRRGMNAWASGDYEAAEPRFRAASELYRSAGLDVPAAVSLSAAADSLLSRGEIEASRALYERILPVARRAGHHRLSITVQSHSGVGLMNAGQIEDAEPWFRGAVDEARLVQNDELLLSPLLNLGILLSLAGKHSESAALLTDARRIAIELDDTRVRLLAGTYLADGRYRLGRMQEALDAYEDLDELARSLLRTDASGAVRDDNLPDVISMLGGKLSLLHALARFDEALEVAARLLPLCEQLGRDDLTAQALHMRAALHATLADYAAAEADLARVDEIVASYDGGLVGADTSARLVRAVMAMQRGDPARAERELAAVREVAEREKWQDAWVPILSVSAEAAGRLGRRQAALRWARQATDETRAGIVERLYARAALVDVLARGDDTDALREAVEEARALMDDGRRAGQPLVVARAAATILGAPPGLRPPEPERIRDAGAAALREFIGRVPDARREAVAGRADVRELAGRLGVEQTM